MGWCVNALCRGIVYLFQAPKGKEVTHSIRDSIPVMIGFQFKGVFVFSQSWEPAENQLRTTPAGSPNKQRLFPIPSLPFSMVGVCGHQPTWWARQESAVQPISCSTECAGPEKPAPPRNDGMTSIPCMWDHVGFLNERYHSVKAEHLLCHLHQYGWNWATRSDEAGWAS